MTIRIDGIPKKLYWYRLYYWDGQLLEAVCATRLLSVAEEAGLYEQWAHQYGSPSFSEFIHAQGVREVYVGVDWGRPEGDWTAYPDPPHVETGHLRDSFRDPNDALRAKWADYFRGRKP